MKKWFLISVCCFVFPLMFIPVGESTGRQQGDTPTVMLIQSAGDVTFSLDGTTWEPVRRNKFLYDGDRVKTGIDGSCKLIDRQGQNVRLVKPGTLFQIIKQDIRIGRGRITDPEAIDGFTSFFERKFARIQKYTSIRRSAGNRLDLVPPRTLAVSKQYPDIVWENRGKEYAYQVVAGERMFSVPPSTEEIVRFRLPPLTPGTYPLTIRILYHGEVIFAPVRPGSVHWLTEAEEAVVRERERRAREIDPENGFLIGNILDEYGFKVAAMDQFRSFIRQNPDINEVRPFLMKVYSELELKKMMQTEAVRYHENRPIEN